MSRRKTVALNLEVVNAKIKEKFRHNIIFCEKMGRAQNWVTDWNRKPKPKNLPSPEEAARMCAILQVEPEEILLEQGDIELVRGLIEKEKNVQPSTPEGEGLDPLDTEALNLFRQLWPDNREHLLEIARSLLKAQQSVDGHAEKDF